MDIYLNSVINFTVEDDLIPEIQKLIKIYKTDTKYMLCFGGNYIKQSNKELPF